MYSKTSVSKQSIGIKYTDLTNKCDLHTVELSCGRREASRLYDLTKNAITSSPALRIQSASPIYPATQMRQL